MNPLIVLYQSLIEEMVNLEGRKIKIVTDRYEEDYGISKDEIVPVYKVRLDGKCLYIYIEPKPDSRIVIEESAICFGIFPNEFIYA